MPASSETKPSGGRPFLVNVLWGWLGVATNLLVGLLLSPLIIRRLGAERYGIWALVFSVLDYLRLFDLGFRAAIVNFTARMRARQDTGGINEIINTGLFYFTSASVFILSAAFWLGGRFIHMFHVPPEYQRECSSLLVIVAVSVAVSLIFSTFSGALESFQRFDLLNHAYIVTLVIRSIGSLVLVLMGFGLVELGFLALASQIFERLWNWLSLRRIFPQLRTSPALIKLSVLRNMAMYGFHSFLVGTSNLVLYQSPAAFVGYLMNPTAVAYFSLPMRLSQYVADVVPRVGFVTASLTAELDETGRLNGVRQLGVYTNRYCFALFVPLSIFLAVYGHELIARWINADFAANSARVLNILMIATAITVAGQFNSIAILIGQGKHRLYGYGLLVENALLLVGLAIAIPRFGIVGAASVMSGLMLLSRGLFPAWLLCRSNHFSLGAYLASIYVMPALTGIPVVLLAMWLKAHWLPGRTWPDLILAAALCGLTYLGLAAVTVVERNHRRLLWSWAPRRRPATPPVDCEI